ncbi:hypothetical protein C7974DRAFT_386722 [Boeremia exigua]|uniref:uncharacterized protein n=1 Tax=Boeremia exigua TaxID=749465 RepID=UPI001E8D255E|nr:uncharacterized protein C7974DRAFT_386722 [Boeremia exigua]KAH6643065.1 hypothetical protein C7974DRAFT_386722 [Boeremia exigua]
MTERTSDEQLDNGETSEISHCHTAEPEATTLALFDNANMIQHNYGLINSASTWNLADESSFDNESEIRYEGSVRVKRLSCPSSSTGSGPTLRISADADAVLLGRCDPVSATPALPEQNLEPNFHERTVSTLAGRVSRQLIVQMASSTSPRTPMPSSTAMEILEGRSFKITPIRSMQLPQGVNTETSPENHAAIDIPSPIRFIEEHDRPISSRAKPRRSFEAWQKTSSSQSKPDTMPQVFNENQKDGSESGCNSTTLYNRVQMQVHDSAVGSLRPVFRKQQLMTQTAQRSTSSELENPTVIGSTNSSFLSTKRVKARVSPSSIRAPSSETPRLAHSTLSQTSVCKSGSSRSGETELLRQDVGTGIRDKFSKDNQNSKQSTVDATLEMKKKRSLRSIFHRRDPGTTLPSTKKQGPERSFVTGSTLAQRIRNSTNFSKISLSRPTEVIPRTAQGIVSYTNSTETVNRKDCRQATRSADPLVLPHGPKPSEQHETADLVHRILDNVTSMGEESPDRLRGLEIAEAILQAVECSKEAKLSAELAWKYARDADLKAQCAGTELERLQKLCQPSFDNETMQAIKQLITAAGVTRLPKSSGK